MDIQGFANETAKAFIKTIADVEALELSFYINVENWLLQKNVKCYILFDHKVVKNILLLSKGQDPKKKHINPYVLDFIYTFTAYRKHNYAIRMLVYIKTKEHVTAICSSGAAENLFKKANYVFRGYDPILHFMPVFQYP
jgi:hypothetical protein